MYGRESGYYPPDMWKSVVGFESYKVSKNGEVINKDGKLLSQFPNKKGYMRVWLNNDEIKAKQFFVHRLVAEAFIPNTNALPMINHKDENPSNNSVDNLEWCDDTYNKRYSQARQVVQYDIYGNQIKCWDTISDINTELGFATTNISKCCKGKIKSSNGFIFLYEGDDINKRLLEINNRKHRGKTEISLYELQ